MRSPGINGEGELRGQLANPGSPGKMAVKTECVCRCVTDRQTDGQTLHDGKDCATHSVARVKECTILSIVVAKFRQCYGDLLLHKLIHTQL